MISNIISGNLLFILLLLLPIHPFRNFVSTSTNAALITAADAFVLSSTRRSTTSTTTTSTIRGIGSRRHLGSSFGGIPKKTQSKRNNDGIRGISSSSLKSRRPRFITTTTLFLSSTDNDSFTFQMASASVAGSDPDSPGKVNQDACFHFATTLCKSNKYPKSSPFYICGGVLDGHGKKGHVLNQFLGEHLPRILEKKLHKEEEDAISIAGTGGNSMENILIDTFHQAHNAARKNETVPAARSGTTCVTCVVDALSGVVYTANVGDSRAILILQHPQWTSRPHEEVDSMEQQQQQQEWDSKKKKSKYNVIPLSRETTTKDANERKRIEGTEQGRIDGNGNVWYGPIGIAMTRALGDSVMAPAGILPTPQVTSFDYATFCGTTTTTTATTDNATIPSTSIHKTQKVRVLIATDGIFDVMTNEEAVEILCNQLEGHEQPQEEQYEYSSSSSSYSSSSSTSSSYSSLEKACLHLIMQARQKWQNDLLLDVRVDDATVVVLEFDC